MLERNANEIGGVSKRTPSVSIGMPVYNGGKYIFDAISTLLSQTYHDFELVVSDNASTDETRQICESLARKDGRIRYIRQEINLGVGKNFEYVLDHSVGTYFMWAAHDDMWSPNWLEVLVSEMKEGDFSVRGPVRFLRGESILVERCPPTYSKGDFIRCFMSEETTMNARNFYIYGLFMRHKLLSLDRFLFDYNYCADFILPFQMVALGNLRCVGGTYQIFRFHDANGGAKFIEKSLGLARLIYRVHPVSYYLMYVSIAPAYLKPIILVLAPIKHVYNQFRLWVRGFRKVVLKIENV